MHRSTRTILAVAFGLVVIPEAALAQEQREPRPLRKSDLVRFLSGTTYDTGEIAAIVRRSCLAFEPTSRDREDFRMLGADEAILSEIDACVAKQNRPEPTTVSRPSPSPRQPPAPLQLAITRPQVSAPAGTIASIPVTVRRGSTPQPGVRLVLLGTGEIEGAAHDSLTAATGADGRAVFEVPVGTALRTYRVIVATPDGASLRGDNAVELTATPAPPARAEVTPNPLSLVAGQQGNSVVVVAVRDEFGNAIEDAEVELRPVDRRRSLPRLSRVTGPKGEAEFQVATAPLRSGDRYGVYVDGKALASLTVAVASPPVERVVAAGDLAEPSDRVGVLLQRAGSLTETDRHAQAEAVLDTLLWLDSDNFDARIRRGYLRSWQQNFAGARADFVSVLRQSPNNASALVGLGYSLAWSGNHAAAEERFRQALRVEPLRLDAQKGLAYVALWRGDAEVAVHRFDTLTTRVPSDAEVMVGLGQAHFAAGDLADARDAFRQALLLEPGREDAEQGLAAAGSGRARLELTAWGGYTDFSAPTDAGGIPGPFEPLDGQSGEGEFGLRMAELAFWPVNTLRVWAKVENGLSLDSRFLVRADEQVPAYYLGGVLEWGGRFFTRLEAGLRNLPDDVEQELFQGEHVVVLENGMTLKGGGLLGPRSDDRTEVLGYGAVGWSVDRFRLEPTVFVSNSGGDATTHVRGLLATEYLFDGGWALGGGLAYGGADVVTRSGLQSETLWDGFLRASVPVAGLHRAQLLLRHQRLGEGDDMTIVALGFTLGLLRE